MIFVDGSLTNWKSFCREILRKKLQELSGLPEIEDTARQSVSIMRYLEGNGFPVPKTILTKNGETIFETEDI